ncbi:MAG: hypothetical protein HKP58_02320, partial [Desulfatitalea sp.]|nr:hypothetical protein [Desulfatitalea sp.]
FQMLRRIRAEHGADQALGRFKRGLREQYLMLQLDEKQALAQLPNLLKGHEQQGPQLFDIIKRIVTAGDPLNAEAQRRLSQMEQRFCPSTPAPRRRRKGKTASAKGTA